MDTATELPMTQCLLCGAQSGVHYVVGLLDVCLCGGCDAEIREALVPLLHQLAAAHADAERVHQTLLSARAAAIQAESLPGIVEPEKEPQMTALER